MRSCNHTAENNVGPSLLLRISPGAFYVKDEPFGEDGHLVFFDGRDEHRGDCEDGVERCSLIFFPHKAALELTANGVRELRTMNFHLSLEEV